MEIEELEVEVTKEVTEEYITINNYKQFLKELNNRFADFNEDFFTKNPIKRLKGLASPRINLGSTIKSIIEYLNVIAIVDNKIPKQYWEEVKKDSTIRINSISLKLKEYYHPPVNLKRFIFTSSYYNFNVTTLPYCCGICEYGNFTFNSRCNIEKIELDNIKYNLFIDLMRLHALLNKKDITGAYNIINYFQDTRFMKALENREDLVFIKEFTNPKTDKNLKSFTFNTII